MSSFIFHRLRVTCIYCKTGPLPPPGLCTYQSLCLGCPASSVGLVNSPSVFGLGSWVSSFLLLFFKRFYLSISRETGREGGRGGHKHQCVVAARAPPTGDLAYNPGMCPDLGIEPVALSLVCRLALNPLSHTSQGFLSFFKFL